MNKLLVLLLCLSMLTIALPAQEAPAPYPSPRNPIRSESLPHAQESRAVADRPRPDRDRG